MKRTLSIIAALLAIMSIMTFAVGAAVGEVESGYTPASGSVGISSLSDITDPAGAYHLTGDITVDATYAEAFSGVLDGCGHTVTVSAPMFAELNGTVKNMTLNGAIEATDTSAAAVALQSTSGMTAMNITSNVDITVSGTASDLYAAAIVCKNSCITASSLFESIVNNGDISIDLPNESASGKPRAAGIAARINCADFTDCMNNGVIKVSGYQSVTGGICARANNEGGDVDFYHCVNNGDITGIGYNAYVGGIAAYIGHSSIADTEFNFNACVNTGDITANYYAAGIVAYVYANETQYPVVENCINTGDITYGPNTGHKKPNTVWGSPLVGYANSTKSIIKNNIDVGALICGVENFANYAFIGCSSADLSNNNYSGNYVTNVATKFNYFAYSATEANVIAIDQAGSALTDTTIDYIKSEEFTNTVSGFVKTDSLPVTQSGDSWNGGEYVMAVDEHVCGNLSYVKAVASTCGTAGHTEYYKCACGKWYSDAEARTEITDKASVVLPLDPDVHAKTYGDVSTITFTGAYNNAETFTLPVTCAHCDWTDSITIVPKMGENYTRTSNIVATCQQTEGIKYWQLDFGTGRTYNFVAYNPDGATDPTRHITLDSYKDNGDCSHTIVYSCCENATKITYHTYSSGLCIDCGASQEERESMHKWEVSYEWRLDSYGIPYGCIARRICSVCNRTNSTSTKDISFVGDEDINCQQGATRTYTAKFSSDWAETQIKSVSIDKNPNNHVSGSVYLYKDAEKHIRQYLCCGAEIEQNHSLSSGKCSRCGYVEGETEFYTITYIIDGEVVATQKVCYQGKITKPTPKKEGYVFKNWYTEENGQGKTLSSTYSVKGDTTYYAHFTDEATVYWFVVYPDGEQTWSTDSLVKVGNTVEPDVSIAPVGYYIEGWYTKNTLTTAFDFTAPIVTNTEIYAKLVECTSHIWGEVAYEWTEDYSGCTAVRRCTRCNYADTDVATSVQVSVTEKATCAKAGSATGTVTFAAEWATDMSGEITIAIDPDNHVNPSVTYKWENDDAGIPYHCMATLSCDACGYMETVSVKAAYVSYKSRPTCQAEGIAFKIAEFGSKYPWAEEQKSEEYVVAKDPNNHISYVYSIKDDTYHTIKYICCGVEKDYEHDMKDDVCLICGYKKGEKQYTVTYMVDGMEYCRIKVSYGSSINRPTTPSKDGYVFVNWFTKENGEGDRFSYTYNIEGDTTYYAYFTNKVSYRFRIVNLEGKQQTIIPYVEVLYGTVISAPAISEYADQLPERYYIEGWYTSSSYATEFDFSKPLIQVNTSIYGKLAECTSHIWGEVAYEWTEDYSGCTAVRRCTRCNYAETDVATSVQVSVTEKATCVKAGSATGTVTFAAEWATDMSGEITIAIDPDNHVNPSVTYKWENDDAGIPYKCTATLNCSECGYKESVSVKPTSTSYNPRPTCQAEGVAYKTARFSAEYPWAEEQKSEEYVVAKDPNNHISYVYSIKDDTYHTKKYICCGVEKDYEHNMSNSVCKNCGYKEGEKQYTVTFMVDGKEFCKVNVCYGAQLSRPQPPAKDGYVFKNWFTEENGKGKSFSYTYNIEGDTTYYAYYTNKLEVSYIYNHPEGSYYFVKRLTDVLYGTTVSPITYAEYASIIPEGYYIEGWYTSYDYAEEFDFSKPITSIYTEINGKLAELKGWCKIDGEWYYYNEDGTKATGFSRVPYNTELGHAPNADDLAYFNANSETSKYTDATTAVYCFGEDGKLLRKTGIVDDKGSVRYAVDGVIAWHVGLVEADGEYYYFGGDVNGGGNVMLTGNVYATRNTTKLDMVKSGVYTFAEDGKMCKYEGLTEIDGVLYYYEDYCRSKGTGVVKTAEGYIYVRTTNLEVVTDKQYWVSKTAESGVIKGIYVIDENGFIKDPILVNSEATTGIFDGYYYVDGEVQYAAGAIEIDGDIYYVRANGQIVAGGEYWVTQSSELLPAGKYTFDNDGKLVK